MTCRHGSPGLAAGPLALRCNAPAAGGSVAAARALDGRGSLGAEAAHNRVPWNAPRNGIRYLDVYCKIRVKQSYSVY